MIIKKLKLKKLLILLLLLQIDYVHSQYSTGIFNVTKNNEGNLTVENVQINSPASSSGIRKGTIIKEINGQSVKFLDNEEIKSQIIKNDEKGEVSISAINYNKPKEIILSRDYKINNEVLENYLKDKEATKSEENNSPNNILNNISNKSNIKKYDTKIDKIGESYIDESVEQITNNQKSSNQNNNITNTQKICDNCDEDAISKYKISYIGKEGVNLRAYATPINMLNKDNIIGNLKLGWALFLKNYDSKKYFQDAIIKGWVKANVYNVIELSEENGVKTYKAQEKIKLYSDLKTKRSNNSWIDKGAIFKVSNTQKIGENNWYFINLEAKDRKSVV